MKLLMTTDTVGGVWSYAMQLAQALSDQHLTIGLAAMGAPLSAAQHAAVAALDHVQVFERPYRLEWMDDPWEDVAAAGDWLLELHQLFQPDLVQLNNYAHGALDWQVPVIMVAHSCVLSWWWAVHHTTAPAAWSRYRSVVRAGLHAATMVVAPTQAMLAEVQRLYGPLPHTQVIANGCAVEKFKSTPKQSLVFAAGRLWDAAKNIAALDAVAAEIAWPIYVAGSTHHPSGAATTFTQLHPLGMLDQDQMRIWLGKASIYALPARYEPFGLSVLEAALSGCALILGDIASLRELWSDAALFVHPDKPVQLQKALKQLIDNPLDRDALGLKAYQRALRYSSYHMAGCYRHLYHTLAQADYSSYVPSMTHFRSV